LQVVVLDASASMQSTDEGPSRFEKAKGEALKWVDGMRDGGQMVVLQVGATTEVRQSPTSDKSALRRAIQSCQVADTPTHLKEALKLAETLTRDQTGAEIHLFSDGAASDLAEFEHRGLPLVYHRVGQRVNNMGVVNLDVRTNPENAAQRALFTTVANYSSNAVETEIELRFDNQMLETKPMKLGPRETAPQVFIVNQPRDGILSVRLTAKDDLAADNQASIVSLLPQPVKVLLVSRGNRFLEKAIRAAPNVQLSVSATLNEQKPPFDLVVLDDVVPAVWPVINTLAIHTASTNWFGAVGRVEGPPIVDWRHAHSLMRFVTFDNVQVAEALSVKTPNWAISLVDSPQSSLILAGETAHQRIVWVAFDTLQSTWPRRVSFPIFIANAIEWLNPASGSQLLVKAGEPFRMAMPEGVPAGQVTMPDGSLKKLPLDPNAREILFGDTGRQGIYKLSAGTNQTTFCVNLLDGAESDTAPREELKFGKYGEVTATAMKRANLEMWRWIALAALGILMFEWWYYHRRTA
ncbi:MAG TPA: VWA domain-containing protein, partial [Verrucomicrobiae bacterium]|nr:VWA domain-containing protein [Verrucomicrobiae bacterium]